MASRPSSPPNCFAHTDIVPLATSTIAFTLSDLKNKASSTLRALRSIHTRLKESYTAFLKGELSIRQVLQQPAELFQFALVTLLDSVPMEIGKGLQNGFHVSLRSSIPIGCGMGSSAATIISVIQAITHFFHIDIKPEWLWKLSVEVEKLQHGHSSGIDSYVSLHGGCIRFQQGDAQRIAMPTMTLHLVNTGRPQTTTGEAVTTVAKHFVSSTIWEEFAHVQADVERALLEGNMTSLKLAIRANHALLHRIGVVPQKVASFIDEVEQQGDAAKICGAGATAGDDAGIVLVLAETPPTALCERYGYTILQALPEMQGARLV
jgi:mevalonate kinase